MSHGPVDVFAARDGNVLLIQVKSGSSRMKKEDIVTLELWSRHFNATAEVWYYGKRGKLQRHCIRKITEPISVSVRRSP